MQTVLHRSAFHACTKDAMRLSAENLVRIASAWHSASEPGHECRHDARLELRGSVAISIITDGQPGPAFGARVYDISAGGVGLLVHQPLSKTDPIMLCLPLEDEAPVNMICTVRHVRKVSEHLYRIGTSFLQLADAVPSSPVPRAMAAAR